MARRCVRRVTVSPSGSKVVPAKRPGVASPVVCYFLALPRLRKGLSGLCGLEAEPW